MRRKRPASLNGSCGDGSSGPSSSVLKCLAGAAWTIVCWACGRRSGGVGALVRRLLAMLTPRRIEQPRDY